MKILRLFSSGIILLALVSFLSCGGGSDPAPAETESQKATTLLTSGGWSIQTVLVDGVDKSTIYPSLKVSFTATGFSATNGGLIWPATGTWRFTDDSGKTISRGDGVSITLNEISSTKMIMSFSWSKTTLGSGREASISGQHVFTFGK